MIIKGNKADANADFLRCGMDEIIKAARRRPATSRSSARRYTDNWEPEQRPDRDGADPDGQQQQDRRRSLRERRHGRWRHRRAQGPGPRRQGRRSPARTATPPPSTGSRSARRPSTSGRTPALLGKAAGEAAVAAVQRTPTSTRSPAPRRSRRPGGNTVSSILLKPEPITKDNLKDVLDAGWITKDDLCKDVTAGSVAACELAVARPLKRHAPCAAVRRGAGRIPFIRVQPVRRGDD